MAFNAQSTTKVMSGWEFYGRPTSWGLSNRYSWERGVSWGLSNWYSWERGVSWGLSNRYSWERGGWDWEWGQTGYLFIYWLKDYSPVNRTGSLQFRQEITKYVSINIAHVARVYIFIFYFFKEHQKWFKKWHLIHSTSSFYSLCKAWLKFSVQTQRNYPPQTMSLKQSGVFFA